MKIKMIPGKDSVGQPNGISRVIENYLKHGEKVGIEFVDDDSYDLKVVHAGMTGSDCDVALLHGIYFTGSYRATMAEYKANRNIVEAVRSAKTITVPSQWVSEVFQRDLRMNPFVVPHGIDYELWDHTQEKDKYVLYNKNRDGFDVCNSEQLDKLAMLFPGIRFVSTFSKSNPVNVDVIGVQSHERMKGYIQRAGVYLSVTKETFGIGVLEALASGVPVLGWRNGGNIDIIKHGVDGYLAEPGNYDDLANGLSYCIAHRSVLGKNGRALVKKWTWNNAVVKLYEAFESAMHSTHQEPSVSVVIPVYNYANKLQYSVSSVAEQTVKPSEIILVDDGSQDDIVGAVTDLRDQYRELDIKLIRKSNGGVATARNRGASEATGKYLVFLDADDRIEPKFIETCRDALEKDRTLHLAYTSLGYIKNGSYGISNWPSDWVYDKQLQRQNQVPTCCMMRHDSFVRLGGYRQRYAPNGAGSEDADLWTRLGAYGMKAQRVSTDPLFTYSFGTGYVSGDSEYREVDWLGWHPFAKNKNNHPFASYATPERMSHLVYEFDEPIVSVIIPVGKGHEDKIVDAIDSIEAQTYRLWEIIVVWDSDQPAKFDNLDLLSSYPYLRIIKTNKPGSGPGAGRNLGVKSARGSFIVFLDADDWLDPNFIEKSLIEWNRFQGIVYTDYYGISTVDPENLDKFGDKVVEYNNKKHIAKIRYKSSPYDCKKAQLQPESPLYHWCLVTCLIPKAWHEEIGGFDEKMESWEDVDYHWRMARAGKCYIHIEEPYVSYRFDTGKRRNAASADTNRQVGQKLLQYMVNKYKGIENMACKTCGQHNPDYVRPTTNTVTSVSEQDENYVLITYNHPNVGDHPVYGPATGKFYNYRSGGDRFLVHKNDAALMPQLFTAVEITRNVVIPETQIKDTPAPIDITSEKIDVSEKKFDLEIIPGVSNEIAIQMRMDGYTTWDKVKSITKQDLLKYKGVGEVKANMILSAIAKMK